MAKFMSNISSPKEGVVLGKEVVFSGWAFDEEQKIKSIQIKVAGEFRRCNYGLASPEAEKAHPRVPGIEKCGFWQRVILTPGSYEVEFWAIMHNFEQVPFSKRKIQILPDSKASTAQEIINPGRDKVPAWFMNVAPVGTADVQPPFNGRVERKPWDHKVTVSIPHLNTPDELKIAIDLWRLQREPGRPYLIIVDTGSPPEVCRELETFRAADCEVNFISGNAYRGGSEIVCEAMDLAQACCKTEFLFHTHSDVFPRNRELLNHWMAYCNEKTPVVGYRLSERSWVTEEWKWMIGHSLTMTHMPTVHKIGATWSYQRIFHQWGYKWQEGPGWPDTETGFNHCLKANGFKPKFLGQDINYDTLKDEWHVHIRSFPSSKMYHQEIYEKQREVMQREKNEALARMEQWRNQDRSS